MSNVLSSATKPVLDFADKLTGASDAADAAREAAQLQSQSSDKAIALQKESRDLARADLDPFKQAGQSTLPGLQDLVNDPNAQLNYIQDNPFFKALTTKASNDILSNQAAKGKVGSGGTAEALQNSMLLLGNDLVNQNISQRESLAGLGENAAAGTANITQNSGNSLSDLITGQGNANAAGVVGATNAITQGRQGLLKLGGQVGGSAIAACDIRLKTDIKEVGKLNNGLPLYLYRYKNGDGQLHIGPMAQDVEKVKPEAVVEINGFKHIKLEETCQ